MKRKLEKIRDDYRECGGTEDKIPKSLDKPFDFTTLRKEPQNIDGEWDPNAPLDEDMKQAIINLAIEEE